MAILNLDKIVLKKTVIGINCKACGGNLKQQNKKQIGDRLLSIITLGRIKPDHYECENCKKHFILF